MAGKSTPKSGGVPPAADCTLVIFGAHGDLTKRLLIPALYNLTRDRRLGAGFKVLGVDHNPCSEEAFRHVQTRSIKGLAADRSSEFGAAALDADAWADLRRRLFYQTGDFEDAATYAALKARLAELGGPDGGAAIFYCATSARFFGDVGEHLAKAGLAAQARGAWRRLVVEKPFGHDLASAKALNRRLLKWWDESQIYRIDHFLGKETVQNILVTRFGNGLFEPLWNRRHVDHVQITACETVGVEDRGAFYEQTGALRDMVPNHMFQLLAMTAMEPPNSFAADDVRAEKAKVVDAIQLPTRREALANSARGQYRAGEIGGRSVRAYRREPHVARDSKVETFVALKLCIDNWRWAGVPFYIRTGKALGVRSTQVVVRFKQAPFALFRDAPAARLTPNDLVVQIQPHEGLTLCFDAKAPGPEMRLAPVHMDFNFADAFSGRLGVGYETLLYDCMLGDQTLFQRADNIELGWRAVQPFLDAWAGSDGKVEGYRAGGTGPKGAEALLARDGRQWRALKA
jgi:glucose-6-phosphate 1-dehydrogenase